LLNQYSDRKSFSAFAGTVLKFSSDAAMKLEGNRRRRPAGNFFAGSNNSIARWSNAHHFVRAFFNIQFISLPICISLYAEYRVGFSK
jgi:hypothetical protein